MDLRYTKDMDLEIVDGEYVSEELGETTFLSGIFTDARVGNRRGYWADIIQSKVWSKIEQSRYRDIDLLEIREFASQTATELEKKGIYDKIYIDVLRENGFTRMEVECKKQNKTVFSRKYKV